VTIIARVTATRIERPERYTRHYRCHICRVDLEYRENVGKFVIVRRDDDTGVRRPRKS